MHSAPRTRRRRQCAHPGRRGARRAVLRLNEPAFTTVAVEGKRVRAGSGTPLSAPYLPGSPARPRWVGIIGGHSGDCRGRTPLQCRRSFRRDRAVCPPGGSHGRTRCHRGSPPRRAAFRTGASDLDEPVLLSAEFELESDNADAIVKRMRRAWIQRKAAQPLSFQPAGRIFKNPRGRSACNSSNRLL